MNRREFLGLCAVGTVVGALAACAPAASKAPPTPTRTSTPTLVPRRAPTDADWATLASRLQGTLVRPDSAQYASAHLLYNTRFDSNAAAGVAYCAGSADVQACVRWASGFALPIAARSGGHSYAGYSAPNSGLIIDVTRGRSKITDFDAAVKRWRANGGNALRAFYEKVYEQYYG